MKAILKPSTCAMVMGLMLLCSCFATPHSPDPIQYHVASLSKLPPDLSMNKDAGRGGLLFVTIQLQDGEALPFILDTGCPVTCLDQSLEPKLGKRVRTEALWAFGVKSQINVYDAIPLYLGKVPLIKTGPFLTTHDCKQMSYALGRPIMGVLGMDILKHYCVQLDFSAGKIRFLDDQPADKSRWGNSFPLSDIGDGCLSISNNLVETGDIGSLIDTGCNYDGWLTPELYLQWTNATATDVQPHSPNGVLDGQAYTHLELHGVDPKLLSSGDIHIAFNGIGLRFLSRHLVTLDFPALTLYLKPVSSGPLTDKTKADWKSVVKFIENLKAKGELPGWSKNDEAGENNRMTFDFSPYATLDIHKKGDPSTYHYQIYRASKDNPWKLIKAWRTDPPGNIINKYPVP